MANIELRAMGDEDWGEVASLIYDSTNAWYVARGRPPIFAGPKDGPILFCAVYEQLDPGCCVVADDRDANRLAGSCFYHPRSTHVSLGIMNVHPDYFGQGVASQLLRYVTEVADRQRKPMRLVFSALNLDFQPPDLCKQLFFHPSPLLSLLLFLLFPIEGHGTVV